MRQFDQSALFSQLLQRDELTEQQIIGLAETVASFHARIEKAPANSRYGMPETVFHPISENFRHIEELIHESEIVTRLERVEQWSTRRFGDLREIITIRKENGFVRECHGDLHLNNITLLNGVATLFDCIEFNPSLRFIDTISEIAFLVMDLEENHRHDFANLFLNRYLQHSGDYAGCNLLRFYQCYRAMVRAKVSILRLTQDNLPSGERDESMNNFLEYLSQAEDYTKQTLPQLIITRGLSGSGKSYISEHLLQHLMAIHLRSDIERKRLFGLKPDEKSDSSLVGGIYSSEATERTYGQLFKLAKTLLKAGFPVIVDATFSERSRRKPFMEMAKELGCSFIILDISAEQKILRDRILHRQRLENDPSEADISVLEHQLKHHTPLEQDEIKSVISINSGQPVDFKSIAQKIQSVT